jgi:hypothetical protein
VQCFRIGRDADARKAAEFLEQNGIPVAIFFRPKDIVIWVREPFSIKGEDAAKVKAERARSAEWIKRVKTVGSEYAKQNGGYDFKLADLELPSH